MQSDGRKKHEGRYSPPPIIRRQFETREIENMKYRTQDKLYLLGYPFKIGFPFKYSLRLLSYAEIRQQFGRDILDPHLLSRDRLWVIRSRLDREIPVQCDQNSYQSK